MGQAQRYRAENSNGGAENEQQRKSADDVIGEWNPDNGVYEEYGILDREYVPVVKIISRKFIQRDKFFEWLDSREKSESKKLQNDKN